jgi:hypothetical protein
MTQTSLDRFNDLQKQGFMRAAYATRKPKKVKVFQVWLANDEGICHEGQDELKAQMISRGHVGSVVKKATVIR